MKALIPVIAAAAFGALPVEAGEERPQALALVQTGGDIALRCDSARCRAELSAFCLETDKASPPDGTRYRLASGSGVTIAGVRDDGTRTELPAELVSYRSMRRHLAVEVSMPRSALSDGGFARMVVAANDSAALVPAMVDGAPAAYDEGELALITQSLRPLGARVIEAASAPMTAVRITNRAINLLPDGPTALDDRRKAFENAVQEVGGDELSPEAARLSRNAFELCSYSVSRSRTTTMRGCLQQKHDDLLNSLNSDYWKAVNSGS